MPSSKSNAESGMVAAWALGGAAFGAALSWAIGNTLIGIAIGGMLGGGAALWARQLQRRATETTSWSD